MRILLCFVLIFALVVPAQAARDFDGTDDLIDCASLAQVDNLKTGGMTVYARIFPDNAGEGNAGVVFGKTSSTNTNGWQLRFLAATGTMQFAHTGTGLLTRPTSTTFPFDAWGSVLVHWDGVNSDETVHIYFNGTEASYAAGLDGSGFSDDSSNNFTIGNNTGGSRTFDGYIAEAAAWNVELSAGELVSLFGGTPPWKIRHASLVLYAPIWGLASPEVDLTPTPNTCTVTGTTAVGHAPVRPLFGFLWPKFNLWAGFLGGLRYAF